MLDPRLNHVVAVARAGSFSGAANAVGVTQSAITKSIADLERQIGFSIFYRTSRGALLTEQGRDFVERTAKVLDDARELLRGTGKRDPYAEVLRIGVCPASMEWRLAEPLVMLLSRHSAIRLEISASSFERVVQQLRNSSIDVAVGFEAAFKEWSDLRREPLGPLKNVLFVRKKHPILAKATARTADLASFDFVSPTDSRPYGAIIREFYESQGVEWQTRIHVIDHFSIVKRIVANSDAIGVVSLPHATSAQFRDRFETLDNLNIFSGHPAARLCCAVRSRSESKPVVRAFIKAMKESFSLAE
jgi:DNA-binding transcriptional LysR family regulator